MDATKHNVLKAAVIHDNPVNYVIPTDIKFYERYIQRRKEFDKKFKLLLWIGGINKQQYTLRRHIFSLDNLGSLYR